MDKDLIRIQQMLGCVNKFLRYCDKKTYAEFFEDTMLQDACIKNIEEIGEKASKISEDFRISHPEIRWRPIIGARNHLVHEYEGVDYFVIWDIIQNDIPELKEHLDVILDN